jgi:HPt (histidine-containing phosphotransfer) domain-containing protein
VAISPTSLLPTIMNRTPLSNKDKFCLQDGSLVELDGIDVEAGLLISCNKQDLYAKLLLIFKKNYHDFPSRLQQVLKEKNFVEAAEMGHSLKGAAVSIGATPLSQLASKLEVSCQIASEEASMASEKLERELKVVLNSISKL